jgi:hypothetical protein
MRVREVGGGRCGRGSAFMSAGVWRSMKARAFAMDVPAQSGLGTCLPVFPKLCKC